MFENRSLTLSSLKFIICVRVLWQLPSHVTSLDEDETHNSTSGGNVTELSVGAIEFLLAVATSAIREEADLRVKAATEFVGHEVMSYSSSEDDEDEDEESYQASSLPIPIKDMYIGNDINLETTEARSKRANLSVKREGTRNGPRSQTVTGTFYCTWPLVC